MAQEAQANWHALKSDSVLPDLNSTKRIVICSNKPTSPVNYQVIRTKCARHQIGDEYFRSTTLPAAPIVSSVQATGYSSAQVSLINDPTINPDTPIAFYTITTNSGERKNVYSWGELNLVIDNLSELTSYTFTVTATTVDGISQASVVSEPVTTPKYVPPLAPSTPVTSSQIVAFQSTSVPATINSSDTSVAVSNPSLLNLTLSFSSQGTPISAIFKTVENPSSSSPFTIAGGTTIIDITMPGFTGSATLCFDGVPTDHLWHYTSGSWIDVTTSHPTGKVCGTTSSFSPFTVAPPKPENTCVNGGYCLLGEAGPGGGSIFYRNVDGFKCGATWTETGSPTVGLCHYLEVAPKNWNGGSGDPYANSRVNNLSTDILEIENNYSLTPTSGHRTQNNGTADFDYTDTTQLGAGLYFSNLINNIDSGNTAARIARSYRPVAGITDFYLPTVTELNLLCQWAKGISQVINTKCGTGSSNPDIGLNSASGAAGFGDYWSSSDKFIYSGKWISWVVAMNDSASYNPSTGSFGPWPYENYMVRPIRAF